MVDFRTKGYPAIRARMPLFLTLFLRHINSIESDIKNSRYKEAARLAEAEGSFIDDTDFKDAEGTIATTTPGERSVRVTRYVRAYAAVRASPYGVFGPLLEDIETLLERRDKIASGVALKQSKEPLFLCWGNGPDDVYLNAAPTDPERAQKAALAMAVQAAVRDPSTNKPNPAIRKAVRWQEVEQYASYVGDVDTMLHYAIDTFVELWSTNEDAHAELVHRTYDGLSSLKRLHVTTVMLRILPMTANGRAYLKRVVGGNGPSHDSRSPVAPDVVKTMRQAFVFDLGTDDQVVAADSPLWTGSDAAARTMFGLKQIEKLKAAGDNPLQVMATLNSAAAVSYAWTKLEFPEGSSARGKIAIFLDPPNGWPKENDSITLGFGEKKVAIWSIAWAVFGMAKTIKENADKDWDHTQLIALSKDGMAIVAAANDVSSAFRGGGGATTASLGRLVGLAGLGFQIMELSLSTKKFFTADGLENQAAALMASTGAAIGTVATALTVLRTIPHPVGFAVGLVGSFIVFLAGWWEKKIAETDMIKLLDRTHFSRTSLAKRSDRERKERAEHEAELAKANPSFVEGDGTGFEYVGYGFLNLPAKGNGTENWLRQIGVIYGATGAFGLITGAVVAEETIIGTRLKITTGDANKDKVRLPPDAVLSLKDASHDRTLNAGVTGLSVSEARVAVHPLRLGVGSTAEEKTWATAQRDAIGKKAGGRYLSPVGNMNLVHRFEGEVTLPSSPAWLVPTGETAQPMPLIVRKTV